MTKREPFTPDEIRAAEIEAAREEGRRAGMMEAARLLRADAKAERLTSESCPCAYANALEGAAAAIEYRAIESKAKEG